MKAKWRHRTLLYLKLITRLSVPQRPGSASHWALSCQEEGDYNILLDKSSLLFAFLIVSCLLPHPPSVVTPIARSFDFPPRFFLHSRSSAPHRHPRRFIFWLICLCVLPMITTLRDLQTTNAVWVFTHKETIRRIMNHTPACDADKNNNIDTKKKKLYGNQKLSERKSQESCRTVSRWDKHWCTHRISSSQEGALAYAFLCQGSMYSRPRWAKMSFSVEAARNSFWREDKQTESQWLVQEFVCDTSPNP